ncbi:VanZ family protein [Halapricum desulfuricans]|uniref:VanZ like family protein n=1 Tax=Halapricum desulfuricans TaxID=2841257 RepID=A0A897N349_9EURY|nr:VanZ family protein [Halapricum desulfuricans]QSG05539.1 VanZ like family protein [Halapricum desulfuricans]
MDSNRSRRLAIVAAVALAILASALVPAGDAVARTGPFGLGLDLWLHALAYVVLETAVLAAIVGDAESPLSGGAASVLVVTAYGLFVEGLQLLVPYRHASAADAVANGLGATVALACWLAYVRMR